MAKIKPFKGILYNSEKIDISKVITPPYDVISPSMQDLFYKKDPRNIVKLILGKDSQKDTKKDNKYTRANKFLNKWIEEKSLIKSKKPSLYIYTQDYLHRGKKKRRLGFIALMKIEDPKESGILPHEYTLAKPKEDRLNLIKNTKANLSPIFSLFQDDKNKINKILNNFIRFKNPIFSVEQEGVIHKLWVMNNKALIDRIVSTMKSKKIFIADGHHRYEVALTYRNKMRKSKSFKKNMDYVMMYFSNLSEKKNMTILSTHRVVKNISKTTKKKMLKELKKYFHLSPLKNLKKSMEYIETSPKGKHAFILYTGKKSFYSLTLKKEFPVEKLIESNKDRLLKKLDVTILHDIIITKILGVKSPENSIKYIRNEEDALKVVDNGDYDLAFFLKPTAVGEMKAIAEKGEMMPQKSTYFYPKLLTGLTINKF